MGLFGTPSRVQLITSPPNVTVIQFDASISEKHGRESPPTEFPVEDGDVISDHIIIKPTTLELTGIISDTPIGGVQQLLTSLATTAASALIPPVGVVAASAAFSLFSVGGQSKSPSMRAYEQLLSIQFQGQGLTVFTSLARYPNMYIKSLSAPRDAQTGKVLLFTLSLIQLTIVVPQTVNIQILANPGLSGNLADKGEQNAALTNQYNAGKGNGLAATGITAPRTAVTP
jgi:hypothetical protein